MNDSDNTTSPDKKKPWTLSLDDLSNKFDVDPEEGLSDKQAEKSRQKYGSNRLRKIKQTSVWTIFINQFKSLVILLLLTAAVLSFIFLEWIEGVAILTVIFINTAIGFTTELKAIRSMEALRKLGGVETRVRRNGGPTKIPAGEIVPGDIVLLEEGDIVSADMRIIKSSGLEADESALTGESLPVSKNEKILEKEEVPLAERSNMLFKGTAINRGSGEGLVISTGMNTEIGHISSMVEEAEEEEKTPLEKRLNKLAHKLIFLVLIFSTIIIVAGILRGKELLLMVETGIALAIACIPEGLPIVATITLSRGLLRMARRNALIKQLSAVETLGATNVIFTDKTGTLTENRMTATKIRTAQGMITISDSEKSQETAFYKKDQPYPPDDHPVLKRFLETGAICNNASLGEGKKEKENSSGDPLEVGILVAGAKAGITKEGLLDKMPEVGEKAFNSEVKMMAKYHKDDQGIRVSVKGAPEAVLEHCTSVMTEDGEKPVDQDAKQEWNDINKKMARDGLRIIAMAHKYVDSKDSEPYKDLVLTGLIGMVDPPRKEVPDAVNTCKKAGIKVIMITGDQPVTASMIARQTNLTDEEDPKVIHGKDIKSPEDLTEEKKKEFLDSRIFARVSPEQKLHLVSLHREAGSVTAMTGDGVNDAPALKKADIGVAMGKRGTQVATETADMILQDDSFSSIMVAVEEGRIIFENIRKAVFYLLTHNVSEILIIFIASLFLKNLPLMALQILFLNFVTEIFPAFALGLGKGDPAVMKKSPRDPRESILTSDYWKAIFSYGILIATCVLGAFLYAGSEWGLGMNQNQALAVSFLTIGLAQIGHVFNMRDRGSGFFKNEVTTNPYVWGSLVICAGLLLMAVYLPFLANILKMSPPGINGWLVIITAGMIPYVIGQLQIQLRSEKKR